MDIKKAFTSELLFEAGSTRKMLSRVPFDNTDWKPHTKSTTLIGLAKHVARLPYWTTLILNTDEIDFSKNPLPAYPDIKSAAELTAFFDQNISDAEKAIANASDDEFMKTFTMRMGDHVIAAFPKAAAIRNMSFNHLVHHRGQLSVYLRLNDIPVPGMYGPSADEGRPA